MAGKKKKQKGRYTLNYIYLFIFVAISGKYYYSCYLIGTIIFFMVSAGVGFFTSYTILLLNNRNKL